jgi:hypothetical protein
MHAVLQGKFVRISRTWNIYSKFTVNLTSLAFTDWYSKTLRGKVCNICIYCARSEYSQTNITEIQSSTSKITAHAYS